MFIAVLFTIARKQQQPKCLLTDKWIIKIQYNLYKGILFNCKKQCNHEIFRYMNGIRRRQPRHRKINVTCSLSPLVPRSKSSEVGIQHGVTTETRKCKGAIGGNGVKGRIAGCR